VANNVNATIFFFLLLIFLKFFTCAFLEGMKFYKNDKVSLVVGNIFLVK
jgi:hypothetical protein